MIKKNTPIKVTIKDGSIILANVTKVVEYGPTDATHIVCWVSKDKTWKGKARLANVVVATPLECAEWAKAQEAKMAPMDPIMSKWVMGTTKRGPKMMEGFYFSIAIYRNGKKCGELVDEGNGGMIITRFNDHSIGLAFEKDCDTWALANGADGTCNNVIEHFWGWYDDARPKGIDAKTFFNNERIEMLKWAGKMGA